MNKLIEDEYVKKITQHLLIYLCGFHDSHKWFNSVLYEDDKIVLDNNELVVSSKDGTRKLKLELNTTESKLCYYVDYVDGMYAISVPYDRLTHRYCIAIVTYVKQLKGTVEYELFLDKVNRFNDLFNSWKYLQLRTSHNS